MRRARPRAILRMELATDEPRMIFELDDLDELSVGRDAGDVESFFFERRNVFGIHFITMTVALFDEIDTVRITRDRSLFQIARIFSESHRAAESVDADEIAQFVDDLVRRFVIELRRVRADHADDVPRELDRRALHAETHAE